MVRFLVRLVLGWALIIAYTLVASACRGPFPQNTREVFNHSSAVFYGRVINIVEIAPHPFLSGSKIYEAKFDVFRWWKGEPRKVIQVRFDTTTCGVRFERGQNWVIFASGSPLGTSALSMNWLILKPTEELKPMVQQFGNGNIPLNHF